MNILSWVIFFFLAIVTLFPILHLDLFKVDKRYDRFKYVSIGLFLWTVVQGFRYLAVNTDALYYLSLAIYPVVYLVIILLFFALTEYLEIKIKKIVSIFLWLFLIINTIITFTNVLHYWVLLIKPSPALTFDSFRVLERGWFFYVHTFVSYILLIIVIAMILRKLYKNVRSNHDYIPFVLVTVGIIIGLIVNILHVFVHTFTIDPTYITFVIVISLLYYTFYIRDVKLILDVGRNRFILDNLKERYVLVDEKGMVISASSEFLKFLTVDVRERVTFDELLNKIKKVAIVYENIDDLDNEQFDNDKLYLSMSQNNIHLPLYKHSGHFYRFYDETTNRKYVHDMHYVKNHDIMTQLYNRNYLEEMRIMLDQSKTLYHVVMFDIDGLKMLNDHLGHSAGDALLKRFSKYLLKFGSKDIIPIRLGGDEFVYIFKNQDIRNVEFVIEQIKKSNDNKPLIETVHFSYGIVSRTKKNESLHTLLKKVDLAMYNDKHTKEDYKLKLKKELERIAQKNS